MENLPPNDNTEKGEEVSELQLFRKLESIEYEIKAIKKLRIQRSAIGIIGSLLLVTAIGIFVWNIISFVKNYNTEDLGAEVGKSAERIVKSKEMEELITEIQEETLPIVRDAFIKELKKEMPKFKKEGIKLSEEIREYIEENARAKLIEGLAQSIEPIKQELLRRYPDIKPERMDAVVKEAQKEFIEELTKNIETRFDDAILDVIALKDSFEVLTKHEDFRSLDHRMTGEIENRLIEAFLELAIYHLDPKKGAQPVEVKNN